MGQLNFAGYDLEMVDNLLTTTRSVRKRLDLDRAVEPEIIEKCLEIAVQAPVGGFIPRHHFVVVTDDAKKKVIGDLYKRSYYGPYLERRKQQEISFPEREDRFLEVAGHLAEHLHEVPVLVIPCIEGRSDDPSPMVQGSMFGQVLQATWSFMLALRARGLGTCWTTIHLRHEAEVSELLGIPGNMTQAALIPVAYYTGTSFRPAKRFPASDRTSWNVWKGKRI